MKDINLSGPTSEELFPEYVNIDNQSYMCPGSI